MGEFRRGVEVDPHSTGTSGDDGWSPRGPKPPANLDGAKRRPPTRRTRKQPPGSCPRTAPELQSGHPL